MRICTGTSRKGMRTSPYSVVSPFKDADLIGFPYRITVGKTITDGLVEFKVRETGELSNIKPEEAAEIVVTAVHNIK